MALDSRYIVSINLQEYLVDKDTGEPLSSGYIEFWQDTSRTTPKLVYQLTGSPPNYTYSALPNPVTLSGIGVPTDADDNQVHIYYYPYDEDGNLQLYYIAVYSEEGVLQYTLEAWPNITEESSPTDQNNSAGNQLSNSQFVEVNFIADQGLTIEFDSAISEESYLIAPDWELIITSSGAGSIIIEQIPLAGSLNIPTNPPDKITFQPEGNTITELTLRQRLPNNPSIWSETTESGGYLSGIMLIQSLDGQAQTISMQYTQSDGASDPQVIVSGSTSTTGYQLLNNTVLLDAGSNTESGEDAQVYIEVVLPTTGYYALTSLQVVGLNDDNIEVAYEQETTNRQIDHLFHYYKPQLEFKPIKSYLCGWDFALNPAQALGDTVAAVSEISAYYWDQTVIFQSIASSVSVSRASGDRNVGSLEINVLNDAQIAVVQYLTVPEIEVLLSNELSSNIVLASDQASLSGMITLWYTTDSTLPNLNTDGESFIESLDSDGKPSSFNGNWTEINRSNYGDAIFTLDSSGDIDELQSFGFNGWVLDSDIDIDSITYFAICIGFSIVTDSNNIAIKSCSLVPGSIPTIPAPQTFVESLKDCEYYYEKSYGNGVVPGTVTNAGIKLIQSSLFYDQDSDAVRVYATGFDIQNKVTKVSSPIVTIYSYLSGSSNSFVVLTRNGSSIPTPSSGTNPASHTLSTYFSETASLNDVYFLPNSTSALMGFDPGDQTYTAYVLIQYTLDSRLGIY